MKIFSFLAIISLSDINSFYAQTNKVSNEKDFDRAEKIFSAIYQDGKNKDPNRTKGGYAEARDIFLELYKQDPTNMNLAFKLGVCYLSSRSDVTQAIPYFSKAVTVVSNNYNGSSYKERKAPLVAYKYLGDAYHLNYQFDKAIEEYEKYKSLMAENNNTDKNLLDETNHEIEMCKTGKRLVADPVNIKVENLGSNVNSTYADYSAVLTADQNTLLFTSRRSDTKGGLKDEEGNYMEDIYISTKTKAGWSKATGIGDPINTDGCEATVGISPDGQTILIYKDDLGDGNIYKTTLNGDVWSKPVKLNENINSKYWEPSASISADGSAIYFISNRPGGFGGRDIYMSRLTPEGDWGKAVNLGPTVNTIYDEDAPFIHPDGVSLSFSSKGHNTMGGFDIFTSLLSNDRTWSEPVNIGYPVNTTDDDVFYVVSPNNKTAYLSSFRKDGLGEKDNYVITFPDRKETPLTLMKGVVTDQSGKPVKDVEIIVTDNETEEVVGVYRPNSKTGQYVFILTPGRNYNITYNSEGNLFYSDNMEVPKESNYYEIYRPIILDPIIVGSKVILKNIFFDFDKATLRPISKVEIKNVVHFMKANPKVKVEISAYTDSKGDDKYNQKLSDERAQSVVKRLLESGIPADRMTAKGYGEKMPVAPNAKENGDDNPEGRQLNRRVEFKITEINK